MRNTILLLMCLSFSAVAQPCDILKIVSKDSLSKQSRIGNGFAYTSSLIVVNDHTLLPEAKTVEVRNGNSSFQAEVLSRDFHTDLAILKINGGQLQPCQLQSLDSHSVNVVGYDQNDSTVSVTPAFIKTSQSTRLMVPGILSSIEFVASGNSELRGSQSGSLLISESRVVGFVSQKTNSGTALAISAKDVDLNIRRMIEQPNLKRKYEFDRRTGEFRFDGLKITGPKSVQGGVNPHEGSNVNPHEGRQIPNPFGKNPSNPQPIAMEDYELGAAVANVEDFTLLSEKQPHLASALREAGVKKVFISQIDGHEIKNSFDLIRLLGNCSPCRIESFWIEIKNPEAISETHLRLMGWLSLLILELEKSHSTLKVQPVVSRIQELNPLLAKLLSQSQQSKIDLPTRTLLKSKWGQVERQLDQLWHSEKTLDILSEIRAELMN